MTIYPGGPEFGPDGVLLHLDESPLVQQSEPGDRIQVPGFREKSLVRFKSWCLHYFR